MRNVKSSIQSKSFQLNLISKTRSLDTSQLWLVGLFTQNLKQGQLLKLWNVSVAEFIIIGRNFKETLMITKPQERIKSVVAVHLSTVLSSVVDRLVSAVATVVKKARATVDAIFSRSLPTFSKNKNLIINFTRARPPNYCRLLASQEASLSFL